MVAGLILMTLFLRTCCLVEDSQLASMRFFTNQSVDDFAGLLNDTPLWTISCQKTNSTPLVSNGRVILLERLNQNEERIRCIALQTGRTIWEERYNAELAMKFDAEFGFGPHSTPAIHEDVVITIGLTGIIRATHIDTGGLIWTRNLWKELQVTTLERGFAATPLIETDRVIVPLGGKGKGVIALSVFSGETVWLSTDFASSYTSPVIGKLAGQRQVVLMMYDVLCGVEPASGELLWQTSIPPVNTVHVASPLIIEDQFVLVGWSGSTGATRLYRIEKESDGWLAEQVWQTNRCTPQVGNFLQLDQQIIAPASGGPSNFTVGLSLIDGSLIWKERFGGRGTLIRLRDGFATLNETGDLSIRQLNDTGTNELFRFPNTGESPQWSSPAFGDNIMVLQTGQELKAWRLGKQNRN